MYIILVDSQDNQGEKLALVDRRITKSQWWTQQIDKAMIFRKISAARVQLAKLKYNNPEIWSLEKGKTRLEQVAVTNSGLSKALAHKEAHYNAFGSWDEHKDY